MDGWSEQRLIVPEHELVDGDETQLGVVPNPVGNGLQGRQAAAESPGLGQGVQKNGPGEVPAA